MVLSRGAGRGQESAPVRLVHLGLGGFFRAHQAWYTEHAGDGEQWGYAAFSGRGGELAAGLTAQECLYTLITRAAEHDGHEQVGSVSAAHPAADHEAWLRCLRSPDLAAVTLTVTEAGYCRGPEGELDLGQPDLARDVAALRSDQVAPVRTAPARLLAGLAARRRADSGPLAVIPCDNLPANGELVSRVLTDLAERVDPSLAAWIGESVSVVSTVVDRITRRTTPADVRLLSERTGLDDRYPVVAEPYCDWVLSGEFPAGRPRWEDAGARFTSDPRPFEHQKLWMLNGAHSLLAYAGSIIGHGTVAEAAADPRCLTWLDQWWQVACAHLPQPDAELALYRAALLERFANVRLADPLERIAADGSQKLPVRVLPVLRAERQAGRLPAAAALTLAAWICHLRGLGAPVSDVRADEVGPLARREPLGEAVAAVLNWLGPDLAEDSQLISAVLDLTGELAENDAGPGRK